MLGLAVAVVTLQDLDIEEPVCVQIGSLTEAVMNGTVSAEDVIKCHSHEEDGDSHVSSIYHQSNSQTLDTILQSGKIDAPIFMCRTKW